MNQDQVLGMLRPVIAGLAGYLAGKGIFFDAETWNAILAAIGTILAAVWSAEAHKNSNKVISAASVPGVVVKVGEAASPEVKAVAVDPAQPTVTRA